MLYYRQVPNLSQTNLNEIYASQTASIERGGHPDMEFLQCVLIPGENTPKPAAGRSNHVPPKNQRRAFWERKGTAFSAGQPVG